MFRNILFTIVISGAGALGLLAQEEEQGRGVARLSVIAGDVSVRRGDTGEWVAAAINAPLLSEDQVLTGANSHAEVQLDYTNFARLAGNAELRLADIENRRYLVRLAQGMITWRVLRTLDNEVEISTPSVSVRPLRKGIYRIAVLEDGSTEITVRSGEVEVFTPRGSERLSAGRTLLARGSADDPEFRDVAMIPRDDWDNWNDSRDRELERSQSYNYVSRDIYGAEDLDGQGRWVNTPEYGQVWSPYTSGDWAPYRNGRWTWVDYYGWSWVSYDPWGWAPYHYGRWFYQASVGWCWWPGRAGVRQYWSPALVGFFGWGGGGGGIRVGVGFGNFGWVPLAPFERYYPWYGRGYYGGYRNTTVVNNINITNVNVTNIYRNARFNNGYTVINGNDFGRGSVHHIQFDRAHLANAGMVRGQLPMTPDRASLRWNDRDAVVRGGAGRGDDRFVSRMQPGRIERVPFENQRASLEAASRRSLGAGDARGGAPEFRGEVRGAAPEVRGGNPADSGNGFRRVGEAGGGYDRVRGGDAATGGALARESAAPAARGQDRGGWRRFGDPGSGSRGGEGRAEMNRGESPAGRSAAPAARTEDRGGWSRFGESRGSSSGFRADPSSPREAPSMPRGREGGNSSFGRGGEGRSVTPAPAPSPSRGGSMDRGGGMDRGSSNRGGARSNFIDRGSFGSRGGASVPSMSAPVVRERPSFGGGRGGGPSIQRSSPSPRMESAPRGGGGGGGGGGSRGGSPQGGRGGRGR